MTNLSSALARTYMQGDHTDLPVKASSAIYEGSAIGITSGYCRHLAAGDKFMGFALQDVPSQTSDGDAYVRLRTKGRIVLTVTSVAVTDIGKPVFASDGNAFTLTQSTNSHIGRVVDFDSERNGFGNGGIAELTDNTTGTASDTLASISDAATKNAVASVAAKVNAILRQM